MYPGGDGKAVSLALRKAHGEFVRRADTAYVQAPMVWQSDDCPLLKGVDLNGNKIFNARQMRQLLGEIERLLLERLTPGETESLEEVAKLCHEGRSPPHQFLWFIGD